MRRGGMTLLEVLIAVALALGLMLAVLSFYNQACDTRRRVLDEIDRIAAQRLVMERVTDELRTAMTYSFLSLGVQGQVDNLTFVRAALPGPGVWVDKKMTEDQLPPQQDLEIVGYRLATYVDDENRIQVAGLERTCQKGLTATIAVQGTDVTASLLTPFIKFVRFQYWDGSQWQPTWNVKELPGAVEITIGAEPLPENTTADTYPYETFRRVIALPLTKKTSNSATILPSDL